MTLRVEFTDAATGQAETAAAWWRANRPAAPARAQGAAPADGARALLHHRGRPRDRACVVARCPWKRGPASVTCGRTDARTKRGPASSTPERACPRDANLPADGAGLLHMRYSSGGLTCAEPLFTRVVVKGLRFVSIALLLAGCDRTFTYRDDGGGYVVEIPAPGPPEDRSSTRSSTVTHSVAFHDRRGIIYRIAWSELPDDVTTMSPDEVVKVERDYLSKAIDIKTEKSATLSASPGNGFLWQRRGGRFASTIPALFAGKATLPIECPRPRGGRRRRRQCFRRPFLRVVSLLAAVI